MSEDDRIVQPAGPVNPTRTVVVVLVIAAAFAAACGQAPLYYSNQNQYFLHGFAWAGYGLLAEDWLASTLDPTPLFSAFVAFTVGYLHPWVFHAYHALLMGVCAAALLGLFEFLVGRSVAARRWPVFAVLLIALYSALARWTSYRYLGQDYPWYFQAGLAGQYFLGGMLQPSMFGVLLLAALALFVRGRPFLAAVCVGVAGTIHPTYLLPGALLTLGFLTALWREGRGRVALAVGALTFLLILPVAAHSVLTFRPTSAAAFAEAQDILVNLRIPHHTHPDLWLDEIAGLQIAWMVLGLAFTWRTQLFSVLAVPFVLAALLTLLQVATGSQGLALLFPWRWSVVLMPVATTVILARLVALPALPLDGGVVRVASGAALAALAVAGVLLSVGRFGFQVGDEELFVMNFVRAAKSPGDIYLLPVRVPDLAATTRGSSSSDFKPLAQKRHDTRLIPVDLQRFRLYSGAPVFVDFKSIPYRDVAVIEWRNRLRTAEAVQDALAQDRVSEALELLRSSGVTHVIVPAVSNVTDLRLREVYADPYYRILRIEGDGGAGV